MLEYERRYLIAGDEFSRLQTLDEISWSAEKRLTDVTFGPSGAESMQIDGWVVRLRRNGENVALQYKAPANSDWTVWNEISLSVDSAGTSVKFLHAIGLRTGLLLDRVRRVACWGNYTLSLDDFPLLGKFLEIELNPNARLEYTPNFADVLTHFKLTTATECAPYGQLMLRRLQEEPGLSAQVERFLDSLL